MSLTPENRQRVLAIAAAACVGLFVADRLLITPYFHAWQNRIERVRTARAAIERGEILLDRETAIRSAWRQMQAKALPQTRSDAENQVLKAVARWTRDSRIALTSLTPQWQDADSEYALFTCRAAANGSLESLARFLYDVETDPLAIRIEEAQITSEDERGGALTLNLRFSGLQFKASPNQRRAR